MKKTLLSFALIGIIAFMASSWTFIETPAQKTVVFELEWDDTFEISGSYYDDCAGEVIDFSGTMNDMGTFTLYDDGSGHANFHYNYLSVSGTGQTSGKTYHFTGAGHLNDNFNSGDAFTVIQRGNLTGQGMGIVSKFKVSVHMTFNANGELTRSLFNFSSECL